MKAERRHELKENELAQALGDLATYVRTHGTRLVLIVGGAVAALLVGWYYVSSRSEAASRDWQRYTELLSTQDQLGLEGTVGEFREIGDNASKDALAMHALARAGHNALTLALQAPTASDAQRYTREAEEAFNELLRRFRGKPIARGVALSGLALAAENRFIVDGDASQKEVARRHLESIKNDPELNATPMQSQAISRLNILDDIFKPVTFDPPRLPPKPAAAPSEATGDLPGFISPPASDVDPADEAPSGAADTQEPGKTGDDASPPPKP